MKNDLISKRALIEFIDKTVVPGLLLQDNCAGAGVMSGLSKVLEETDVIPIIDAVPVVRCRECRHHDPAPAPEGNVYCFQWDICVSDGGFCHCGEMEGGAKK